jgi:hypothetical protein
MVTAIRDALRKAPDDWNLSRQTRGFLLEQLPGDWRQLVRYHGTRRVFPLLAANKSVHDAREQLNGPV